MNYIPRERFDLLGNGKIRKDDILFCLRGSLGKFAGVGDLNEGAIASSLVIIRPGSAILNEFVLAYLQSDLCAEMISQFRNGAAQPNLAAASLKKFRIPVPPLPEQQRIVGILDKAFAGIAVAVANAEKNLQNARALFESHLQSVFTQRGEGWEDRSLVSSCDYFFDSAHRTPKYQKEGIPALRPRDVVNGRLNLLDTACVSEEEYEIQSKRYKPAAGDIVYSRELSYGWAALLPETPRVCLSQGMCIFRPNREVDSAFLLYFLNSLTGREQATRVAVGSAHPHINLGDIKSYSIPRPSCDEQKQIARQFDALAAETKRLASIYERKLAALLELKKSLLHQAFRGEL